MNLTKKERKQRAELSRGKRAEKRKAKKAEIRAAQEKQMAEYLLERGWKCTGPMKDVWVTAGWDRVEDCKASLRHAYKIQQKLDTTGYQRPASIDDDLGAVIFGD